MPQLNILEKAISKISPKFGVKRLADKCKLVEFNRFAAAYPMKDRMPSRPLSGGEGFSSTFERIELIKAARDLEDNNPIIRSILHHPSLQHDNYCTNQAEEHHSPHCQFRPERRYILDPWQVVNDLPWLQ